MFGFSLRKQYLVDNKATLKVLTFSALTTLSVVSSLPSFAATRCLIAPDEGAIFVRSQDGKRTISSWNSFTLVDINDNDLSNNSVTYVKVQTQDGKMGYVARLVIWKESACKTALPPDVLPEPVTPPGPVIQPTPVQPFPSPGGSVPSCDDDGSCQRGDIRQDANAHRRNFDYSAAREKVYFEVDKRTDSNGMAFILSAYSADILMLKNNQMPDASHFNIEHTYPQSKLKEYPNFGQTKADMYHLFAIESKINGARGNLPFCEANGSEINASERESHMGSSCFEPPDEQKGATARAMMYMTVAYDLKIDSEQEKVLRKWNLQFPVSDFEFNRAKKIEALQGNINPFVFQPDLADQIGDF
jgi:hypothetical protein